MTQVTNRNSHCFVFWRSWSNKSSLGCLMGPVYKEKYKLCLIKIKLEDLKSYISNFLFQYLPGLEPRTRNWICFICIKKFHWNGNPIRLLTNKKFLDYIVKIIMHSLWPTVLKRPLVPFNIELWAIYDFFKSAKILRLSTYKYNGLNINSKI